jgi:membrane protease YdiL (CAAX protease family)
LVAFVTVGLSFRNTVFFNPALLLLIRTCYLPVLEESCEVSAARGYISFMPSPPSWALPWDFWLILILLCVVLPWRGRARVRSLMALPAITTRARIKLYGSTILFQWVLTAVIAWRAYCRGFSYSDLALSRSWSAGILSVTVIGAALIGVLHWLNVRRMSKSDHPALVRLRALATRLFPRSSFELMLFVLLALTAGICEEFIFRGFVMAVFLRLGIPGWQVVLFSSAIFGVAHLYQGKGGIGGTAILGIIFAVVRITYYSLLPVIVWHATLDIVAGIAGRKYLPVETAEPELLPDALA